MQKVTRQEIYCPQAHVLNTANKQLLLSLIKLYHQCIGFQFLS